MDDDVQAGPGGLSFEETVRAYPRGAGVILAEMRRQRGEAIAFIGERTGIPVDKLQAYESGTMPSHGDLIALAKHFGADVNKLASVVGAIRSNAALGSGTRE